MVESKLERVGRDDDPDRCQASAGNSQCPYKKIPGSGFCTMHGGSRQEHANKDKAIKMYRLAQWQSRVDGFSEHDQVKSLRGEIGILRLLMEETLLQCEDATSLLICSGKISDLAVKIDKVVASCHRLEASTGMLLDKTAALQLASVIVEIIGRHVPDQDAVDMISQEIMLAIVQQKPDLKVERR